MNGRLTCPVCGYQYESGPEGACGPCPLHSDCAMACCPACGHTTINTQKSRLVQWFEKLFTTHRRDSRKYVLPRLTVHVREEEIAFIPQKENLRVPDDARTLDQVPPGEVIQIDKFSPGLSLLHQLRLQAFGVEPGQALSIIQQHPVTIVQVDRTELAVERYLAHQIYVN